MIMFSAFQLLRLSAVLVPVNVMVSLIVVSIGAVSWGLGAGWVSRDEVLCDGVWCGQSNAVMWLAG